jgi:hypothetical protein
MCCGCAQSTVAFLFFLALTAGYLFRSTLPRIFSGVRFESVKSKTSTQVVHNNQAVCHVGQCVRVTRCVEVRVCTRYEARRGTECGRVCLIVRH